VLSVVKIKLPQINKLPLIHAAPKIKKINSSYGLKLKINYSSKQSWGCKSIFSGIMIFQSQIYI